MPNGAWLPVPKATSLDRGKHSETHPVRPLGRTFRCQGTTAPHAYSSRTASPPPEAGAVSALMQVTPGLAGRTDD